MAATYSRKCIYCNLLITNTSEKLLEANLKSHLEKCKSYKRYVDAEGYMSATGE